MSTTKILSFDPASLRNIGWASMLLLEEPGHEIKCSEALGGTFVMPDTNERYQVLWPMFLTVDLFLEKNKPDLVICEQTSSFAGGFITGQVSQCMGVILAACGKHGIPVKFVSPSHVKKVVTGSGKATKTQIKKAVKDSVTYLCDSQEPIDFDSAHAYDAMSGIICWLKDKEFWPKET